MGAKPVFGFYNTPSVPWQWKGRNKSLNDFSVRSASRWPNLDIGKLPKTRQKGSEPPEPLGVFELLRLQVRSLARLDPPSLYLHRSRASKCELEIQVKINQRYPDESFTRDDSSWPPSSDFSCQTEVITLSQLRWKRTVPNSNLITLCEKCDAVVELPCGDVPNLQWC